MKVTDRNIVIVDTSSLHRRPDVLNELVMKFEKVIIPSVVILELEKQKDNRSKSRSSLQKTANLILSSISKNKENIFFKDIDNRSKAGLKNDEIIMEVAKREKGKGVVILTEDKVFGIRCNHISITAINIEEYDKLFKDRDRGKYDHEKTVMFMRAVEVGDIKAISETDIENIDVNFLNGQGFTPLIVAIRNRNYALVKLLIEIEGVDINKRDIHKYKLTPLSHAVQINNMNIIKLLIERGVDIDLGSQGLNCKNTPLMIASWNNKIEIVREILKSEDISVNQIDSNGFTALTKASIRNNYDIVKLLIEHGSDKKIRCFKEMTAFDYAVVNMEKFKTNNNNKEYNKANKIVRLLAEKQ